MNCPSLKDIKTPREIGSFFQEDDFIPESDYKLSGINKKDIPKGFKVWRYSSPPLRNYPNVYGGNAYGISIMEMVMQGVDEESMSLLNSGDIRKINTFYQEKGIYIVRSNNGGEYYLVPENIEAGLRKDIADEIDQIGAALENHIKETPDLERPFRVGTYPDTSDLIFNVLRFRFPNLQFVKIDPDQPHPWGTFDFIYITSDILEGGTKRLKKNGHPHLESGLKRFISSLICLAYKMLDENGVFFVLHNQWVSHPKKSVRIRFRKDEEEELKKILIFCHLFGCSYNLNGSTIELSRHSFVNYLQCPLIHKQQAEKMFPFKKDVSKISAQEISSIRPNNQSYSERVFRFDHLPVLNRIFRNIHTEVFLPDYLKEIIQERFHLKESAFFTTWVSVFKKQETLPLSAIELPLVEEHLPGAPLMLTAEYKNTFRFVIEVLSIIRDIMQFELSRTEEEINAIKIYPFQLHEDDRPIGQIMQLQSLYNADNPYFSQTTVLITKTDLLEELKGIIDPQGETTPILENFDILHLMGFSLEELREIFLIVTEHGPVTRIVFGKYPLKSMEVFTNKIHQEGYSYHQVKNLLECFIFHSIAEALAANNRRLKLVQWDRFFEILERAKEVSFNLKGNLDWEILQKKDVDKADGTLKMVAHIMLRIYKMELPAQIITNLQSRTDEELFIDAGYDTDVFRKIKEVRELIQLMEMFKKLNYPQNDFSKPYFFRDFLDCEFHGTGRTIGQLGLIQVFKLLWMSVIPAESHKINFNSLPTGEALIGKIKQSLDSLSEHDLALEYLEGVKKELQEKGICYIYDTGFQLKAIQETRTLEVQYEDIDENINKMIKLLKRIKGKKISRIKIGVLQEIESLYMTIENYPEVYDREIRRLKGEGGNAEKPASKKTGDSAGAGRGKRKVSFKTEKKIAYLEKKNREIRMIRDKISYLLSKGTFQPKEIFTNLKLLFDNCPRTLNLTIREIEEYRQIKIKRKEHTEPAANYILRCMRKFQAIATGNLDELQNLEAFANLCRKEFGNIARQTIGLKTTQLNFMKKLYRSLPADYQEALMIAMVFQDVGKIPKNILKYKASIDFSDHGRGGAKVLEREKSLQELASNQSVIDKSIFLIYHHGLIGQIIKGEDPLDVLKPITATRDPNMLDAFLLHCLIAAAAFKEDLLSYDMFEKFLAIYSMAVQVLNKEITWKKIYNGMGQKLSWEVQAVRDSSPPQEGKKGKKKSSASPKPASLDWTPGDEAMAMHRLFKLFGAGDIRYTEVLRTAANPGLNCKYFYKRERSFRSLGLQSFESQFAKARDICTSFHQLPRKLQGTIISNLSGKSHPVRLFAMGRTAGQISGENYLKFALWVLSTLEYQKSHAANSTQDLPYIDLFRLSNVIDDRKTLINKELREMTLKDFGSKSWIKSFQSKKRGLRFKINPIHKTIQFFFIDPVDISRDIRDMKRIVNINELNRFYRRRLLLLSNDPSVFKDQIRLFARQYRQWLKKTKLLAVKRMQARMENTAEEILGGKREFTHLKKIYDKTISSKIFDDQHLRLLRDKYEYTMGRLRDDMVQNMIWNIYASQNLSELEKHYIEIINFMKSHQPFFQKELQKHLLNQYLRRKDYFKHSFNV